MKTQLRSRTARRTAGAILFACVLALGFTACDPNAPTDCSIDCIVGMGVADGGDTVSIYGEGGVLAEATIYADSGRKTVVGYARDFTLKAYHQGLPITKYYQGLPVQNPQRVYLKPNTTYWYTVKATGNGPAVWHDYGTIKTKQRYVTVTWTTLNLFDDSDLGGAGELTFHMRANGGSATKVLSGNFNSGYYRDDLSASKVITGGDVTNTVEVRGYDDDCDFSTCTLSDSVWTTGSNGDLDWGTAKATFTVPYTYGSGTWTASVGQGSGVGTLGFTASGTWNVRYDWA